MHFCATRLAKETAPLFHLIGSETKTNRESLAPVSPRVTSATCICFEFSLVDWIVRVLTVIDQSDSFSFDFRTLS